MAEDLLFDLLHTEIVNQMYDNMLTNNEQVNTRMDSIIVL